MFFILVKNVDNKPLKILIIIFIENELIFNLLFPSCFFIAKNVNEKANHSMALWQASKYRFLINKETGWIEVKISRFFFHD